MISVSIVCAIIVIIALALGVAVGPWTQPRYSNPAFDPPLNWADIVQGICGLALLFFVPAAAVTFLGSFL